MPSVRVKKRYSALPGHSASEDGDPQISTLGRDNTNRPRSRTITSIFRNQLDVPLQSERRTSSASSTGRRDNARQTSDTSNGDESDPGYAPGDDDDTNPMRRSWVMDSVARRKRSPSNTFSQSQSPLRNNGFLAPPAPSEGPSRRPVLPSFPSSRHRSRGPSMVSSHGPEGLGVDMTMPEYNLRGAVASVTSLTSGERRGSNERNDTHEDAQNEHHHHHHHHFTDPFRHEELDSSDYTTDGSEIDEEEHHLDDIVEHLDVIDPQVATVSHLSNAANSILIPRLPIYSRRPVVTLPTLTPTETLDSLALAPTLEGGEHAGTNEKSKTRHRFGRRKHPKDQDELDAHVEHVLKRRAKFRRTLRGVGQFLKTPAGIVTAIYGFLVAFWGAAIVLFLVRWINVHNEQTQKFWIEISSQIENALFTVTGIGLIPWRVMDTMRILRIWRYKRLDAKLRKKQGLPPLENEDDLPDPDLDPGFTHVLTEKQQRDLKRQQKRFMKSQTWYRPHATDTHRAFPISTALLICLLIDGNSVFQCFLCGTMWGLSRYDRPPWTTGLLIPASFLCGIAAAVFIGRGGSKTKKRAEVEERLREALDMEKNSDDRGLMDDFAHQQQTQQPSSDRDGAHPATHRLTTILTSDGKGEEDELGDEEDIAARGREAMREKSKNAPPVIVTTFGGRAGRIP